MAYTERKNPARMSARDADNRITDQSYGPNFFGTRNLEDRC